jgi:hypothetical protein
VHIAAPAEATPPKYHLDSNFFGSRCDIVEKVDLEQVTTQDVLLSLFILMKSQTNIPFNNSQNRGLKTYL